MIESNITYGSFYSTGEKEGASYKQLLVTNANGSQYCILSQCLKNMIKIYKKKKHNFVIVFIPQKKSNMHFLSMCVFNLRSESGTKVGVFRKRIIFLVFLVLLNKI